MSKDSAASLFQFLLHVQHVKDRFYHIFGPWSLFKYGLDLGLASLATTYH